MKTLLIAAFAATAMLGTAHAERFSTLSGAKLEQTCTSRDAKLSTGCTAYIEGVSDSISLYQQLRPRDGSKGAALPSYVCVPEQVTGIQMREAVVRYIKQSTDNNTRTASVVVANALREAYACR